MQNDDSPSDAPKQDMYLVVGYRDHLSSTYRETKLFGLYGDVHSARKRINEITGVVSNNLGRGNHYCCWINKVTTGSFKKTVNAGALDIFNE